MKKFSVIIFVVVISFMFNTKGISQIETPVGADGLPLLELQPIDVNGKKPTKKERKAYLKRVREYERLRRNIALVYPLAKACGKVLNDVNSDLIGVTKDRIRKKYLRRLEKELFQKYENRIRKLTITQGKILIKLIDRECEDNAFSLIEEYKSWRAAAFWQLIAKVFGANLKSEYDPKKEPLIEYVVQQLEKSEHQKFNVTYHQ